MNRIRVPLVLLAATLLAASCARMDPGPDPGPPGLTGPGNPGNPCNDKPGGVKNNDAPVVCIDDSASVLVARPDVFLLHEKPRSGAGGSPAVQFFTMSGRGALKIVFDDEKCVRNVVCRHGHCTAVAAKLNAGETQRRCKYDVELTGHPTLDPEGILVGCCVADPTP
jgi:hypothetical protein